MLQKPYFHKTFAHHSDHAPGRYIESPFSYHRYSGFLTHLLCRDSIAQYSRNFGVFVSEYHSGVTNRKPSHTTDVIRLRVTGELTVYCA